MRIILVAALVLTAGPALAHPPPLGLTGFSGGLLHPLFVPVHLMSVLALGLLIGRQTPDGGRVALAIYVVALIAGLGVLTRGVVPLYASEALLTLSLVTGGLVALARRLPRTIGWVLAAATGLSVGLDSPPDVISVTEANMILLGTGCGAAILLLAVIEAASKLTRGWEKIGARIVGSWIAASAMLVLALRLAD